MKNRHFSLFSSIFFISTFIFLFSVSTSHAQWVQTNGPEGGQINGIVSQDNNIFIATYGGIFVSTNNGVSWEAKNNGLEYSEAYTIFALDDILFASSVFNIYRSTDYGESWTLSYDEYTLNFGTDGTNIFASLGYDGVIMTTDKGDTWQNIGLDFTLVNNFVSQGNILYAGTSNGIYVTTNQGKNWTISYTGLPSPAYIMAFSIKDSKLFVSVADGGVYCSTNNGANWFFSGNGLPDEYTQSFFVKENLIYAATHSGVYVSSNNGISWGYSSAGINYISVSSIHSHDNFLFAGTSNGVYFSGDGENWSSRSHGLNIISVYSLTKHNSNIFAGTLSGIYKTQNGGSSWENVAFFYPTFNLFSAGEYLYALSFGYNLIYRTSNDGLNWQSVYIDSNNLFVYGLMAKDNYLFAATTFGVYRSNNNGQSWSAVNNGITNLTINSIITHNNAIYVGTSRNEVYDYGKIFKSINNGNSWEMINIDSVNADVGVLGAKDETIFAARGRKLYSFNSDGENWTQISNMPNYINEFTISHNSIIAATQSGIFVSTNNGVDWMNKNQGFNGYELFGKNTEAMLIDNNNVYASQDNESIWIRNLSDIIDISPSETPSDYELKQNYPNPFNPITTIEFSLPIEGNTSLDIYDIRGRLISSLVNQNLSVGNYKVTWNASGVSSGIYFYKLITKHFTQTKRMMLIK